MLRNHDQNLSIVWLDASTEASLLSSCQSANASSILTSTPELLSFTLDNACFTTSGKVFAIFDDIDLPGFASSLMSIILRRRDNLRILFTTKNLQCALQIVNPTGVTDIGYMEPVDATALLISSTGTVLGTSEEATSIAHSLQLLPSAIAQAGRFIRFHSITFPEFIHQVADDDDPFTPFFQQDSSTSSLQSDTWKQTIIPAKSISMQNAHAVPILFCLACFGPTKLPIPLLAKIARTYEEQDALSLLKAYYLLGPSRASSGVRMHPLVRRIAISLMKHYHARTEVIEIALQLAASLSSDHPANLFELAPHLKSLTCTVTKLFSAGDLSRTIVLCTLSIAVCLCDHFTTIGKSQEAFQLTTRITAWVTTSSCKNSTTIKRLESRSAAALYHQGQFGTAARMLLKTTRSQILQSGEHHVDTIHSLNNLGLCYQDQGRFQDAENCHRRALNIKEQLFGRRHPETFVTMNNLALSLLSQKRLAEAESLFFTTLSGRRMLLDKCSADVHISMANLAVAHQLRRRYPEAIALFHGALVGFQARFDADHPEILKCKGNIALLESQQMPKDDAVKTLREVSETQKCSLPKAHPDTLRTLRNLAVVLHRRNEFVQAEDVVRDCLILEEFRYGKGDLSTFTTLQHLSTLLHLQKKFDQALEIAMGLLDMRCDVLGNDHQDTKCSFNHVKELQDDMAMATSSLESSVLPLHLACSRL